ncbi:homing endonuclease associated repeat-containing protein [Natronorubrum sp. A-ect3]|uniref:homing endonuclease associated repeat-containing protein n=1 Tax=Natronorubrum sp. A-ect3 TaxID=3242698 RepID=UPI00359E5018
MTRRVSNEDLLDELRRLSRELDCVPTAADMTDDGKYGVNTYSRRFGSWTKAIESAGLEPSQRRDIPTNELIEEIDHLCDRLGRVPTADEMNEKGKFSEAVYADRFGSWNSALEAAGCEVNYIYDNTDEELLAELCRVRDHADRTPRKKDMDEIGEFHSTTYINRFESWNTALKKIGCELNQQIEIGPEAALEEVKRVADLVDGSPTQEDFTEYADFSLAVIRRHLGGWNAALEAAGLELNRRNDVTREELLEEIERLYERTGETPTLSVLDDHSKYTRYTYYNEFGSWTAALEECDFKPETGGIEYTKEELLTELHRLAEELDRTPTTEQMTRLSKYGVGSYQRHFGSWNDALIEAGLAPNVRIDIPREELLEELEGAANRLGRSPTREEIPEMSKFSAEPYKREFGSWNEALRASELPVVKREKIADEELLDDLQRVAGELGGTPSRAQMERHGTYFPSIYPKRFGTWNAAVEEAGLEPTPQVEYTREKLLANLEDIIDCLGHVPTQEELNEHGDISEGPYHSTFGSWSDAIQVAGFEPRFPRDGEYDYTYYGANWQRQREKRISVDGYQCRRCGMGRGEHYKEYDRDLSVHHIRKFNKFSIYKTANVLANLITVCEKCHRIIEGKPKSYFNKLMPDDIVTDDKEHYRLDMFK